MYSLCIHKIVCFGLGSMATNDEASICRHLAVIAILHNIIREHYWVRILLQD